MGCCSLLLVVFAAILAISAPNIYQLLEIFDVFKEMPQLPSETYKTCERILAPEDSKTFTADGFEDVVYVDHKTALACAGNLHNLWHATGNDTMNQRKVEDTPPTECVLLTILNGKAPHVRRITIKNFPQDAALFVHGVSIRKSVNEATKQEVVKVYAVNHAHHKGGERIDVFELDVAGLVMTFIGTIGNDLLSTHYNGILNDVTVLNDKELLVTSWLPEPMNPRGKAAATGMWEKSLQLRMYGMALTGTLDSQIIHCHYTVEPPKAGSVAAAGEGTVCNVIAHKFMIANGITSIPTAAAAGDDALPTIVAFTDVAKHAITLFTIPSSTPAGTLPTLTPFANIPLRHAIDNIELDPNSLNVKVTRQASGGKGGAITEVHVEASFYMGDIVNMMAASKIDKKPDTVSPGGVTRLDVQVVLEPVAANTFNATLLSSELTDLVLHDGHDFQGTSSGVRLYEDPEALHSNNGVVVMGSYMKKGMIACDLTSQ